MDILSISYETPLCKGHRTSMTDDMTTSTETCAFLYSETCL